MDELGFQYWEIPENSLCPTYDSRLNYIKYINEIFQNNLFEVQSINEYLKKDNQIKGIDIGTGCSLIYPLIGYGLFKWQFIATDISKDSIENANTII